MRGGALRAPSFLELRLPRVSRHQSGGCLVLRLATRQRLDRQRDDAVDNAGDVVEIAQAFRQLCQSLAVTDGLVRHREREMQPPIELDLAAVGQ